MTAPETASTESERMAAFDIQVELVTRIGVQELEPGTGSLREALSSLHALFGFTRETLREYSISLAGTPDGTDGTDVPLTVQVLADDLLNRTLRQFLSTWHPRLAAYEALCPPGTSPLDHEARWPEAGAMREELAALRAPLRRIAGGLAAISGADFGVTEAG